MHHNHLQCSCIPCVAILNNRYISATGMGLQRSMATGGHTMNSHIGKTLNIQVHDYLSEATNSQTVACLVHISTSFISLIEFSSLTELSPGEITLKFTTEMCIDLFATRAFSTTTWMKQLFSKIMIMNIAILNYFDEIKWMISGKKIWRFIIAYFCFVN